MKLPKNYFENLSTTKYREYLKLLPNMQKENTRIITMLIFTFLALSVLGLFAINPTLATIIELHKQLEESKFVHEQLTTKINNLSNLQQQYTTLSDELVYVYDAIPQNALAPTLVGQLNNLGQSENVQITSIRISPVILSDTKAPKAIRTHYSFTFTLEAKGNYEDLIRFTESLTLFNRIVTIETVGITRNQSDNSLKLTVQGREYFKK